MAVIILTGGVSIAGMAVMISKGVNIAGMAVMISTGGSVLPEWHTHHKQSYSAHDIGIKPEKGGSTCKNGGSTSHEYGV
jgi:hypothetical protein